MAMRSADRSSRPAGPPPGTPGKRGHHDTAHHNRAALPNLAVLRIKAAPAAPRPGVSARLSFWGRPAWRTPGHVTGEPPDQPGSWLHGCAGDRPVRLRPIVLPGLDVRTSRVPAVLPGAVWRTVKT